MSLGASLGFLSSINAKATKPDTEKITMLTPDGKLVSVKSTGMANLKHTPPASNTEVKEWMNNNGNKDKLI
nr:hypothetical protein [Bacteroidota bacterium]